MVDACYSSRMTQNEIHFANTIGAVQHKTYSPITVTPGRGSFQPICSKRVIAGWVFPLESTSGLWANCPKCFK